MVSTCFFVSFNASGSAFSFSGFPESNPFIEVSVPVTFFFYPVAFRSIPVGQEGFLSYKDCKNSYKDHPKGYRDG